MPFPHPIPDEDAQIRTQPWIAKSDWRYVMACRPGVNTISITTAHLYQGLINGLKRNTISALDDERFEQFVTGCVVLSESEYRRLLDRSVGGTSTGECGSDGGRRNEDSRQAAAPNAGVVSDLQERGGSRGKTGKSKKGKTGGQGE